MHISYRSNSTIPLFFKLSDLKSVIDTDKPFSSLPSDGSASTLSSYAHTLEFDLKANTPFYITSKTSGTSLKDWLAYLGYYPIQPFVQTQYDDNL